MDNEKQKEVASVNARLYPSTHQTINKERGYLSISGYIAVAVKEKRDRDQSLKKKKKNG